MADNLEDLARRIAACEREHELQQGSRRLGQSAIGAGGLRIYDQGGITIGTGGNLTIIEGDLVLGAGMIDGDALANQISATNLSGSATRFDIGTSWSDIINLTYQPPAWARQVIIIARSTGIANNFDDRWSYPLLSRFHMSGAYSPEAAGTGFIYQLMRTASNLTNAWSVIRAAQETMEIAFQVRSAGRATTESIDNRVGVQCTAIAMT